MIGKERVHAVKRWGESYFRRAATRVLRSLKPWADLSVLGERVDIQTVDGFRLAYRVKSVDEDVIAESFSNDLYLPELPEYAVGPDHVILDIGAHIGTFALNMGSLVPHGRVFAVEACRQTFALLSINIAMNRGDNITPVHLAIGGQSGVVTLHHSDQNWGHTIVSRRGGATSEVVPAKTLSEFVAEHEIRYCDFMKLNCEGAEFPILLSSTRQTLSRFGAMLVLYHCDLYPGPETERELAAHLRSAGFDVRFTRQSAKRGWLFARRRHVGESYA